MVGLWYHREPQAPENPQAKERPAARPGPARENGSLRGCPLHAVLRPRPERPEHDPWRNAREGACGLGSPWATALAGCQSWKEHLF